MPAAQWTAVLTPVIGNPEVFHCRLCNSPHVMAGDQAESHLSASHGMTIAPITCSVCGWQFKHIGRFASHTVLHVLKKPCHECSKHFANAAERFAHLCERHNLTKENSHLFK